jgi:hypothetical protein
MKRTRVTIPDDLEVALNEYVSRQEPRPALGEVIQAALRWYLLGRGYLRASKVLRITPARKGSGLTDVSRAHDRYMRDR